MYVWYVHTIWSSVYGTLKTTWLSVYGTLKTTWSSVYGTLKNNTIKCVWNVKKQNGQVCMER